MTKTLALAILLALPALAQIPDGDANYNARAEGSRGGQANPARIDAAIAAFKRAIAANPNDLEAHWKLLAAYRFKGAYSTTTNDERKKVYGEAKVAGEKARALADRLLAAKGITAKATEKQVADAAKSIPGVAETMLWDAINWGEWALAYGKIAAAKQGAADRIRRQATIAHLANPHLAGGTPSRLLGRLHEQTPRIPFITGWASSKEAVKFLNESLKIDPTSKITLVFLAEALVANDSKTKPQAIQMLRGVISSPNNPELAVEDARAVEDAKAVLKKWGNG